MSEETKVSDLDSTDGYEEEEEEEDENVEEEEEEEEEEEDTETGSTTSSSTAVNKKKSYNSSTTTDNNLENPKKRTKSEIIVDIESLNNEKKSIDSKLISLEKQIYALEGRYLEETHHIGNVIRGWDSYISGSGALKKLRWRESDRLFSNSSSSYQNSVHNNK
ncbi:hypothetical protein DLAC_00708 [Tieghemostelium lacteum]|uniref:Chromatin modification-related protein MEAF6 n=1 Tax=Tieghemostelium lacteum TaxID=361077 RepID=A0A152A6Q8_TIELA|nr:hypothetical protein DLAC_00708 [Tieghemostelium lacteum]|eukprot:KYR01919.1 hypothetical protein DLAC_00708 [Tieghemostelium lacteum]